MKPELILLFVVHGPNGSVGADQIAHRATDAEVCRVRALLDTVIEGIRLPRFFGKSRLHRNNPLPENGGFDGLNRTDGRAPAA